MPVFRLYRYFPARYGVAAIENRELRVGRLAELNDPFEFMPGISHIAPNAPRNILDQALNFLVEHWKDSMGIISFASQIKDPVIWSHYAESHRGIALAFDFEKDDFLWEMDYPEMRPVIELGVFDNLEKKEQLHLIKRILSAKAPSWKYEGEYRVFVELEACRASGGNYFRPIPDGILKEVILGIRCEVSENYIEHTLKASNLNGVKVKRAQRSAERFEVNY